MNNDNSELWDWFGSSRASFMVLPRVLMHEMSNEWQSKMAELLDEYDNTFQTDEIGIDGSIVTCVKDGKMTKTPAGLVNYRHPDKSFIEKCRIGK